MKRYRFLSNTFLDFTRNIYKANFPPEVLQQQRKQLEDEIGFRYGLLDAKSKVGRFLEFEPPNMCIITEYLSLLHSISDSYVLGSYYPTLTGACSLGERIFNILILRLRGYYKDHPLYKSIHSKSSFQDWNKAITVLIEWKIINQELEKDYRKLGDLRNESIHFGKIADIQASSLSALRTVMNITDKLFGMKSELYFWCPGELYLKQSKESEPFVKEFIIPNCVLLGYKNSVVDVKDGSNYSLRFQDHNDYDDRQITDEEYRKLRTEWHESQRRGSTK